MAADILWKLYGNAKSYTDRTSGEACFTYPSQSSQYVTLTFTIRKGVITEIRAGQEY